MTDQQNPFSNMPEPPAAPDPAQAFDNAQCQGQAAQSYDVDQTAQEARPTTPIRLRRNSNPTSSPTRPPTSSRSRPISRCTPNRWPRRRLRPSIP